MEKRQEERRGMLREEEAKRQRDEAEA